MLPVTKNDILRSYVRMYICIQKMFLYSIKVFKLSKSIQKMIKHIFYDLSFIHDQAMRIEIVFKKGIKCLMFFTFSLIETVTVKKYVF